MIEPQTWVADALARMKKAFGPRLAYLGLQGSYRRGEATETSDIDLVVLLDTVEPADLISTGASCTPCPRGIRPAVFAAEPRNFSTGRDMNFCLSAWTRTIITAG